MHKRDPPVMVKPIRRKMAREPLCRNLRHFFQGSRFSEQMCGSWNDEKFLLAASEFCQGLFVQVDDGSVLAAHDQECWYNHGSQGISSQIGSAAARDYGGNLAGQLSRGRKRGCCTGAGAEITDS